MSASPSTHLKRCTYCEQWTDGAKEYCEHCGHEHDKQHKEEVKKRTERGDPRLPIIQVQSHDPIWLKILKRPVQVAQLILYAFIAFLVYLTTVFAH